MCKIKDELIDNQEEPFKEQCECCKNLDELDFECLDAVHHGASYYCEECGADYYEEYMGEVLAANEQAQFNHPELKKI